MPVLYMMPSLMVQLQDPRILELLDPAIAAEISDHRCQACNGCWDARKLGEGIGMLYRQSSCITHLGPGPISCRAGKMAKEDMQARAPQNALLHPAQALRNELQNSAEKLKDSNRQLQAAIDNGDRDPELRQAIGVRSS